MPITWRVSSSVTDSRKSEPVSTVSVSLPSFSPLLLDGSLATLTTLLTEYMRVFPLDLSVIMCLLPAAARSCGIFVKTAEREITCWVETSLLRTLNSSLNRERGQSFTADGRAASSGWANPSLLRFSIFTSSWEIRQSSNSGSISSNNHHLSDANDTCESTAIKAVEARHRQW